MMRISTLLAVLILCTPGIHAATITGKVYTADLQEASSTIILVNSTPAQRVVVTNGEYTIDLGNGTYILTAIKNTAEQDFTDTVILQIKDDATYSYDFILFPTGNITEQQFTDIDDLTIPDEPAQFEKNTNTPGVIAAIILLIALTALVIYNARRSWKKPAQEQKSREPLSAELEHILNELEKQDGRATQKELYAKIPGSEAKLSMMITELEAKGYVQKIKRGRTNLIIKK